MGYECTKARILLLVGGGYGILAAICAFVIGVICLIALGDKEDGVTYVSDEGKGVEYTKDDLKILVACIFVAAAFISALTVFLWLLACVKVNNAYKYTTYALFGAVMIFAGLWVYLAIVWEYYWLLACAVIDMIFFSCGLAGAVLVTPREAKEVEEEDTEAEETEP